VATDAQPPHGELYLRPGTNPLIYTDADATRLFSRTITIRNGNEASAKNRDGSPADPPPSR
jgi:hypothetical protein